MQSRTHLLYLEQSSGLEARVMSLRSSMLVVWLFLTLNLTLFYEIFVSRWRKGQLVMLSLVLTAIPQVCQRISNDPNSSGAKDNSIS